MEVVLASSSSTDVGLRCWDLHTGDEQLRYKSCTAPAHGLVCVGERFLAASQLSHSPAASSGSIHYWSWSKPQVGRNSFPEEPIKVIASNDQGTLIAGGGKSGNIYLWEVDSGILLGRWYAHYGEITCLVFSSEDDFVLISGSQDGRILVWNLLEVYDDSKEPYMNSYDRRTVEATHTLLGHSLRVTDIVISNKGSDAIILSASQDCTCKVWSLSKGEELRTIKFPRIINAVALGPVGHVFYAGCDDGNIYIGAQDGKTTPTKNHGQHIIGSFASHSKSVTCLVAYSSKKLLISGSDDGMVRVWKANNIYNLNIIRVLKHSKGRIDNIIVVKQQLYFNSPLNSNLQAPSREHGLQLPPALEKRSNKINEEGKQVNEMAIGADSIAPCDINMDVMKDQIKQFQQEGSAAALEMENERLQANHERSKKRSRQRDKEYATLARFCIDEFFGGDEVEILNGKSP